MKVIFHGGKNGMKKQKLQIIIGTLLMCSCLTYIGIDRYTDIKSQQTYENAVYSTSTTLKPVDKKENTESDLVSDALEALEEDQTIEEVKEYKNVLEIPSVDIVAKINEGVTSSAMSNGVGHFEDTADAGQVGNVCLAGHSSATYNCILNNLSNLNLYEDINLYDAKGKKYTYKVISKFIVTPDNTRVLEQKVDSEDKELTIVTCVDSGKRRLIVRAQIMSDEALRDLIVSVSTQALVELEQANNSVEIPKLYEYFTSEESYTYARYNIPIVSVEHHRETTINSLFPAFSKL